jgi:tRNA splicing ligase
MVSDIKGPDAAESDGQTSYSNKCTQPADKRLAHEASVTNMLEFSEGHVLAIGQKEWKQYHVRHAAQQSLQCWSAMSVDNQI